MNYERGASAEIDLTLRDGNEKLADPTSLTLQVLPPDGETEVREWPGEGIAHPSTGIFSAVIALDQAGEWEYRWQASGAVETASKGTLVVGPDSFEVGSPSPRLVTLSAFRPPAREDGSAWTKARIEGTNAAGGDSGWVEVKSVDLEPLDTDPRQPMLRGFSVLTAFRWVRITFRDSESNASAPTARVCGDGEQFRPSVAEIASSLRARTYSKGHVDPDEPMAALSGGDLLGEFTEDTQPTAAQVEREITKACTDVARRTGRVPGELLEKARGVAAVKAAAEVERSYIPTQAEDARSIFQTLRMSGDEELGQLASDVQWWVLANRPTVQKARCLLWWWVW
jgi:hypothetical protein